MKMAHTWVALEKAVQEFAPCEGGYDQARVRILREISSNPEFAFNLNGKPPKVDLAKGSEGDVRKWFGTLAEANASDAPDTEMLEWFKDCDKGPQVSFEQTRAIWIVEEPKGWVSNSDLNPEWNESEALAWIATMDTYIVGQSQNNLGLRSPDYYIGLVSFIVAEKCQNPHHRNDHRPKWQTCKCLGVAWDQLRRLSLSRQKDPDAESSTLTYDVQAGCVRLERPDGKKSPRLLKKHVFQLYPIPDPTLPFAQDMARLQHQVPTGSAGRPSKGKHFYMDEFARREQAHQLCDTLANESRQLLGWFIKNHPLVGRPTEKTIQNAIRNPFKAAKLKAAQRPQ